LGKVKENLRAGLVLGWHSGFSRYHLLRIALYEQMGSAVIWKRMDSPDYRAIKRAARSRQMSIAEWVQQALDLAHRREPVGWVGKKLEVIRAAARGDYPTGDIDRMLAEIETGYRSAAQQ
jgi:hypothetical protein